MKLIVLLCVGMIAVQQANALFHHDWYDWYDDEVDAWCKKHLGQIAAIIKRGVATNELQNLDQQLVECLIEYNVIGYVLREPNTSQQLPNNRPMNNRPSNTRPNQQGNLNPLNVDYQDVANVAQDVINANVNANPVNYVNPATLLNGSLFKRETRN